ncbi:uncharacterized protein [Ptychodera flava]|uniref:uncharacterized protein isoform X1 n=1 Tax=Ptychodera flava TaxID=63121 RepID=UPI00396A02EA
MANTLSEALLVLTSWNTASDDLTSQPTRTLVKDFCENTLKSDEVSKLYCTVLDVEVSEDQKKDAESVGVTLIPATRSKWADPDDDPAGIHWLFNHDKYYQQLKNLHNIKHVVSFSSKTKNAAAAIHESLFPQAKLHQLSVPTPPGVVFAFDAWSRDACGLTGYNRAIIQDFLARKAESEERYLKAYSTVVDVELTAGQIQDAEKCGVTLIKAQIKNGVDEMPKVEWLVNHESYFPDLGKLENIKYVVGYSPKTGWAAIDIRKKLFPDAKLVLINHACQEKNCLLVKSEFSELEQEMLYMASHADLLFSIGPITYDNFKRAYRTEIGGRKLYDIPHKEILPKPRQQYFDNEKPETEIETDGHSILTYGQLNTEEALKRCDSIAASIGSAANKYKEFGKKSLEWKIHGVTEQAYKKTKSFLLKKLHSSHAMPKPYKHDSEDTLLQSIQQSDLCLPPSCYTDYSFEGLEAMAAGLPTTVQDDSHIAGMIDRHFKYHKDYCVVRKESHELNCKIKNLTENNIAIQNAKQVKEALAKNEAMTESLAKFASLLTDKDAETQKSDNNDTTEMQETVEVQPGIIARKHKETTEITEVQPGRTSSEDRETKEITAAHSVMSVTEGVDTKNPTIMQYNVMEIADKTDNSENITQIQTTADEKTERNPQRSAMPRHKYHGKTKAKNNDADTKQIHPKMLKNKDRMGRKENHQDLKSLDKKRVKQ